MRRSIPLFLLLLMLCAGCGGTAARTPTTTAAPTATIAAATIAAAAPVATSPPAAATAAPLATNSPTAAAPATTTATATAAAEVPAESPFSYVWPEYVPDGMAPAPAESRIARDGELGPGDIGFFIVTFNGAGRKLVIGGGAAEAFPISGGITAVEVAGRSVRLVTSGDQRQLVLPGSEGTLFIYGVGLAEEELVRVAESLRPVDVAEMRRRAGVTG